MKKEEKLDGKDLKKYRKKWIRAGRKKKTDKKEENKLVKTKKSLDLSIKNNNKNYFPIKNDINIFLTPIKPLKKSIIKTKSPKKKEKELEIINENKNIENKIIFERNNSNFNRIFYHQKVTCSN